MICVVINFKRMESITLICLSLAAECRIVLPSLSLTSRNCWSPLADCTRNFKASKWLRRMHKCSTEPSSIITWKESGLALVNSLIAPMRPLIAAKWRGSLSSLSIAKQISGFMSTRAFTISVCPSAEARWRGQRPSESTSLAKLGFLFRRASQKSKCPSKEAMCNGVSLKGEWNPVENKRAALLRGV